jgi:hypothetical protein
MRTLGRILILAGMASFAALPAARASSADSSGYAIVLPFVANAPSFNTQTQIFVENHSTQPVGLVAYYVGERQSANPGLLKCSEGNTTPTQTFALTVPGDGVLQFGLRALLEQKCKGSLPAGSIGDRGTLTLFTAKGGEATRISALARVERIPGGAGTPASGFSQPGLPIGALEGSTQVITGARNGALGSAKLRTDCLISSLYDASGSGNLYRITLKDSAGNPLGSKLIALAPWSAELLTDVFSVVGVGGMSADGAMVEVEPAANPGNPSMIAACRVVELTSGSATLLVGKVYEPRDLLRQRRVTAGDTPGAGRFVFVPGSRALHWVFLRHPDLVACTVNSAQLALTVTAPDGTFLTGGFQSTLEFDTGPRGVINNGVAGAWEIEVDANQKSPPTAPLPYTLTCVSGNGMSQLDRMP